MSRTAILAVCKPCATRNPYFDLTQALEECREYAVQLHADVVAEIAISTCDHCGPSIDVLSPAGSPVPSASVLVLGGHPWDDDLAEYVVMNGLRPMTEKLFLVGLGPVDWNHFDAGLQFYRHHHNLPRTTRANRPTGRTDLGGITAGDGAGGGILRWPSLSDDAEPDYDEVAPASDFRIGAPAAGHGTIPDPLLADDFDDVLYSRSSLRLGSPSVSAYIGPNVAAGGGGRHGGGGVPLGGPTGPLPHDGLFIRRNNAFGTKSAVGVPELIEQSILPDQTQIRFDDFVAGDPSGVPVPSGGEAIRVSHGRKAVEGRYKAHDATTHFVEIALRAAPEAPVDAASTRALAVNFIFVVDVSWSMNGEKLAMVKAAIRELYAKLRPDDVLGIISFDTQVRTILRATRVGDLDEAEMIQRVNALRAGGGTDLNLGLLYGIDEIGRYGSDPNMLNCIYLFSDGDPTSGERDWITIRKNVAGRLRGGITLSCFGFGSDARTRELDALAGLSGGHSTFVTQPEDVSLTLSDDVKRRDHLAAVNIQLRIDFPDDLVVWHLYGHNLVTDPSTRAAIEAEAKSIARRTRDELGVESLPDLITDETGIRIFAPDLAYGETYWIVFEVQTAGGGFGTARVQYVDTGARANRHVVIDLGSDGDIVDQTVLAHGIGLWTSEVTFFALDDLYENDRATAAARLQQHAELLRDMFAFVPISQLRDDWVTLDKMSSLAGSLGQMRSFADGSMQYTTFVMNEFGRARGGYRRL